MDSDNPAITIPLTVSTLSLHLLVNQTQGAESSRMGGVVKYLSLFSGIGGFELGIQQAYESNFGKLLQSTTTKDLQEDSTDIKKRQDRPTCVGYSEIDKYATQVYQKHFPNHKAYGDITKLDPKTLPDFELLVGGFPCQAFSIAGKRKGFDDTRGTLFFDIARILRAKQPRLFLLENVKGLLSHDNGDTFKTIIATLDELGYDLQWQVLNSKNHGVPQNRERVFIVGHLRGTARPEVFPLGEDDSVPNEPCGTNTGRTQAEYSSTLRAAGNVKADQTFIQQLNSPKHSNDRVYGADGIRPTLNTMQGGMRQPFVAVAPNGKEIDLTNMPSHPVVLKEVRTELGKQTRKEIRQREGRDSTARGKHDKKYVPNDNGLANCITTGQADVEKYLVNPDMKIRRLTPVECERLQGFPDGWTEGVSDTQRYKCLGNAVTVNTIQAIMEKLL